MSPTANGHIIDLSASSPPPEVPDKPAVTKRKAETLDNSPPAGPDKKARTDATVEISGRKLTFSQLPYQRTIPRKRLRAFEDLLFDAEDEGRPLDEISPEFYDVVVFAGHEMTAGSESLFIKHLKAELQPKAEKDLLPAELLAPLVPKLFKLKQYGFIPTDFGVAASRFPASMQIRSWEANDLDKFFPADRLPELLERRSAREAARRECEQILEGLDDAGKTQFIKGEKNGIVAPNATATPTKDAFKSRERSAPATAPRSRSASPGKATGSPASKSKKTAEEEEEDCARKEQREGKKVDRDQKKKEREEKKAAKEREEQKKSDKKAKQAQMFGSFFKKKPTVLALSRATAAGSSSAKSASTQNDFQRTFKPFVRRVNVEWTKAAAFKPTKSSSDLAGSAEVASWSPRDFLDEHLGRYSCSRGTPRARLPRGLKTAPPNGTVGQAWTSYQEAADPRPMLRQLNDRNRFPWKTLAFDQELRPPYCGTHTKASVLVGPRTPFAQDPTIDYSYDSGDEWQDEEGGDDVDEFAEGEVEDDGEDKADDGEFDDWLDDEDDIVFQDVEGDVTLPSRPPSPSFPESVNTLAVKKPKKIVPRKVVKLTPTWRGPVWESRISEPVDGLEMYRIQLLNDTPCSIDPFKFESAEPLQHYQASFSDVMIGQKIGVRCIVATEEVHHAPKASKPTAPTTEPIPTGDVSAATASTNGGPKSSRPAPKVAFPPALLPELLRTVDGNTKILSDLISTLKEQFDSTTKAAIEAKVREVATREGKSKDSRWRVKAEAWAAAGVTPPARGIVASFTTAS